MNPWLQPVRLAGRHAVLEPVRPQHRDALVDGAKDGELWKLWYTAVPSPEGMAAEIGSELRVGPTECTTEDSQVGERTQPRLRFPRL